MPVQQALYRRYRPQTFAEMIGQKHIATALSNQIKNNTISHAYIFNGTRGVGKTSAARIFARAVNCLDSHNGEPCLNCANCVAFASGGNVDIVEIDAASNNGVDYARDLRERVAYAPSVSKYKVYIIDEAQMLSSSAFDALLKTLEEPPEHVIFILCTTEIHKFPATILSRCMRFDFHLVSVEEISALLCKIFDDINVKYTEDAVNEIASAGEGSVRDALTIADRCVALSGKKLSYDTVLTVLGATAKNVLVSLGDSIIQNQSEKILDITDTLVNEGKSITTLARDLCKHFRDMIIIKTCKNAEKLLLIPDELFKKLSKSCANANVNKLLYAMEQLALLEPKLRESLAPQVLLEAVLLKIASSSGLVDVDGLDMRITRLERNVGTSPISSPIPAPQKAPAEKVEKNAPTTISPKTEVSPDKISAPNPSAVPPKTPTSDNSKEVVSPQDNPPSPSNSENLTKPPVFIPSDDDDVSDNSGLGGVVDTQPTTVKSTMTATAASIWADLLAVARMEGEDLFIIIASYIKVLGIKEHKLEVSCNVTQKQLLNDKKYESLIKRVLGKYSVQLRIVEPSDSAENVEDEVNKLFGGKIKTK